MSRNAAKESLGWTPFFEGHWNTLMGSASAANGALFPARVVGEERGSHRLQSDPEVEFWGVLTGRARRDGVHPAVGDWVACSREPFQSGASIHETLPRASCLIRRAAGRSEDRQVLAANVDVGFVVMSLDVDFNPRRIERYLTTIWDGGARPVVLLTKLDLCSDPSEWIRRIEQVAPGVEIQAISAVSGAGMPALDALLEEGRTAVLLGSSGTGKSTLINHLLGGPVVRTQPPRDSDGRGRHTTTSRHLWVLHSGALVIDTPGMRELQLWADVESLDRAFDDVSTIAGGCRFTDCRHRTEPGCAIKSALENGGLTADRLESYDKLRREMEFQARKQDRAAASHEKSRWKAVSKLAQAHTRRKRWED